jgi:hypothetical protein
MNKLSEGENTVVRFSVDDQIATSTRNQRDEQQQKMRTFLESDESDVRDIRDVGSAIELTQTRTAALRKQYIRPNLKR